MDENELMLASVPILVSSTVHKLHADVFLGVESQEWEADHIAGGGHGESGLRW